MCLIYRVYSCHVVTFSGCWRVCTAVATTIVSVFRHRYASSFFFTARFLHWGHSLEFAPMLVFRSLMHAVIEKRKHNPFFAVQPLFIGTRRWDRDVSGWLTRIGKSFSGCAQSTLYIFRSFKSARKCSRTTNDRTVKRISRNTPARSAIRVSDWSAYIIIDLT